MISELHKESTSIELILDIHRYTQTRSVCDSGISILRNREVLNSQTEKIIDRNQRKGTTELHTFLRPSFDINIVLEPGFESPGSRKKRCLLERSFRHRHSHGQ